MSFKVAVLGVTGFIGRNIAEHLSNQHPDWAIRGIHHSRPAFAHDGIQFERLDLCSEEGARKAVAGADVVIQAAATTSGSKDIVERPYLHVTDNAVMNAYVLQAAYEARVKSFLFFSCSVMYPSADAPQPEKDFFDPAQIHPRYFGVAQTKLYIESLLRFYARLLPESSFTALRQTNIYGPWDKFDLEKSHVCGASVTKVMRAEDRVVVWGSGEEERDLLYVADLCDLVERIVSRPEPGFRVVNAGQGSAVSVARLVALIIRLSGKALRVEHDLASPSIPTRLTLDCSKASRLFGWRPAETLESGLAKTLAWYREHYPT